MEGMMRRLLPQLVVALALLAAAPAAAAKPVSWAAPQIKLVAERGMMGVTDPARFRPDDPLTLGALTQLVAGLTETETQPAAKPAAPATIAVLDARLVGALGLADVGAAFARAARTGGVTVPGRFGTEVVARLLGLRTNHPAARDDLELLPTDVATRAEAAFSAAKVLGFSGWEPEAVRGSAATFVLPELSDWQKRILTTAFRLIGFPYVWGGTSDGPEAPFGVPARGGFDCSGFVWRVYKLQSYPGAPRLATVLRGRSTYQMSGEVPKAARIPRAKLQPADVVFFGVKGPRSRPSQVDHMGIYVGSGWFVHSSRYGVALAQLSGWYSERFAWGRRPLAEAGLLSLS
jgi:cell wall-associated NlpC family hydrolase